MITLIKRAFKWVDTKLEVPMDLGPFTVSEQFYNPSPETEKIFAELEGQDVRDS